MGKFTVKKLKKLSYAKMVDVKNFSWWWVDAMVKRVCLKCRKPNADNSEKSRTGLCLACEQKMSDADKKAFESVKELPGMSGVALMRGVRDGKKLGKELLKKELEYRRWFFKSLEKALVKKIETNIVIK